jgi:hypothetical protein
MNKFLLIVTTLLVALAVIGWTTSTSSTLTLNADRFLAVAEYVGLLMLLVNGTFYSSKLFQLAVALIGVVILGALLKILHSPFADPALFLPFLLVFIVYVIHFRSKKPKTPLDILKLIMLAFFLTSGPLFFLGIISDETNELCFSLPPSFFGQRSSPFV